MPSFLIFDAVVAVYFVVHFMKFTDFVRVERNALEKTRQFVCACAFVENFFD